MKSKKISALVIAGTLLGVGTAIQANHVEAKAAKYKIIKQSKIYNLDSFWAKKENGEEVAVDDGQMGLLYEEPHLTSNSKAAKKINSSLHQRYTKELKAFKKDSQAIFDTIEDSVYDDWSIKNSIYYIDLHQSKAFISGKYFSVAYDVQTKASQGNHWGEGVTYSLKTGKKLKFSDVLKGNSTQIKNKILKKQNKQGRTALKYFKVSEMSFIVKKNKVYPTITGRTGSNFGYIYYKPVKVEK